MATFRELMARCEQDLTLYEGLEQFDILDAVNRAYRDVTSRLLTEETLTEESFTFAVTDGDEKDVSGDLTNWRGEPLYVTSSSDTDRWEQITPYETYLRRKDTDEYKEGRRVYGVQGDYIVLVAAFGSDETVTIVHFKYPDDLADPDDVPLLPTEFHDILVAGAVSKILGQIRQQKSTRWERLQPGPEEARSKDTYDMMFRKMAEKVKADRVASHRAELDQLGKWSMANQALRHRYRGNR